MDATVVGMDVSKSQLDVHVRGSGESFVVPRDAEGLAALIERLRPLEPSAIGLEATGGFETFVAAGPASAGLPVVVVNPAQVRAFANALGKRAKTDVGCHAALKRGLRHFPCSELPRQRFLPQ
jgi:transposase